MNTLENFNKMVNKCFYLSELTRIMKIAADLLPSGSYKNLGGYLALGDFETGFVACAGAGEFSKEEKIFFSINATKAVNQIMWANGHQEKVGLKSYQIFRGAIAMNGMAVSFFGSPHKECNLAIAVAYAAYCSALNVSGNFYTDPQKIKMKVTELITTFIETSGKKNNLLLKLAEALK